MTINTNLLRPSGYKTVLNTFMYAMKQLYGTEKDYSDGQRKPAAATSWAILSD